MDEKVNIEEIPPKPVLYSPDSFIQTALDKGLGIEYLERLMALKKDWDAQQARKAFDEAMLLFQSKCPIIKKMSKGGQTKAGQVAYHFAPIEDIVAQTKDLIAECGFAYLIKAPKFTETSVEVTVEVRHVMGHSEISSMTIPLLTKTGVMSDAQVVGGTNTFAKRYAFCNAFGIMTMDGDIDAVSVESKATFADRIKQWDYTDYIQEKANNITIGEDFKRFIDDLPPDEDVNAFKEILSRLDVVPDKVAGVRAKLWNDFQKLHKGVSKQWLEQLNKAKIIKQKEVHNG